MPYKNPHDRRDYAATHKKMRSAAERARGLRAKLEVLTHYGKDGKLQCCWPDCVVIDPDMLSIDHINDDGAKERGRAGSGINLYLELRRKCFPEGYQTLCHNHQWKKEIMRRAELCRQRHSL